MRREGTAQAAPEAVRQAVGGGCQSGWGRLLSVTNAIEAGTCRRGDSGWVHHHPPKRKPPHPRNALLSTKGSVLLCHNVVSCGAGMHLKVWGRCRSDTAIEIPLSQRHGVGAKPLVFNHTRPWRKCRPSVPQPPRIVTCELSRVCCRLGRSQHNTQHMQNTRERERLVKRRLPQKVRWKRVQDDLLRHQS